MPAGTRTSPEPQVPGIGRRLLSMLYESLLAFAVVFFAGLVFYWLSGEALSGETRRGFQLYLFASLGLYFVACWSHGGRTLPMQTWKLRLVRTNGEPVGVAQAMLRYVLAWPSVFLVCVGLLWALVDRDKQFLHDRLSGTRIILHQQEAAKKEG